MTFQAELLNRDNAAFAFGNLRIHRLPEARGLMEPAPGYHYHVVNLQGAGRKGFADLTFHSASEFSEAHPDAYAHFMQRGLNERSVVADLVNFYPHGLHPRNSEFRKGVGTAVFDLILQDCKSVGATMMFVVTTTSQMRNFLWKRAFEPLREHPTVQLLRLDFEERSDKDIVSLSASLPSNMREARAV